ncbi:MAG: protein kinase [Pseudonocardia sp.]|nr:protein kinase [Pseudonocardia sp.]
MELAARQLIGDRYRLTQRIAVGGMGEVWQATDMRLGRAVAVKVLRSDLSANPEFLERFRVEAQTTALINHHNIAAVHDYGEDPGPSGTSTAYLVMELVHGEPLSARLAARGRLGPIFTLDVLEQAGHALQAAHDCGFIHRDVKPGNILLADDGTVKLTDFGIAKAANSAAVTRTGMVMGTAHYIAPEQAKGEETGPASDVYALGVVGYECLAGYRPFRASSTVAIATMHINEPLPPLPVDVPANVRALIESMLIKDPNSRYASGAELVAAVSTVRRGQPPPRPGSPRTGMSQGGVARSADSDPSSDGLAAVGPPGAGLPALPGMDSGTRSRPIPVPARRGRSLPAGTLTVTFLLLAAAAVVIGVLVVHQAATSRAAPANAPVSTPLPAPLSSQSTPVSQSTPASRSPTAVSRADQVGRSAAATAHSLDSLGLTAWMRTVQGSPPKNAATCIVTDVTPTGELPKGSTVIVTCEQR